MPTLEPCSALVQLCRPRGNPCKKPFLSHVRRCHNPGGWHAEARPGAAATFAPSVASGADDTIRAAPSGQRRGEHRYV